MSSYVDEKREAFAQLIMKYHEEGMIMDEHPSWKGVDYNDRNNRKTERLSC